MPRHSVSKCGPLSKLSTVLLGVAALSSTAVEGKTLAHPGDESISWSPKISSPEIGEVFIRADGDQIYLSDDGISFEQFTITNSPEGARLKEFLKLLKVGSEPLAVPIGRTIVADGGSGAHRPRGASRPNGPVNEETRGK